MLKGDVGGVMPSSKGGSAMQNTAVGSGSRPNGGKIMIPTSAPADAHKLERYDGKNWLK
jgi:hypothetical protein